MTVPSTADPGNLRPTGQRSLPSPEEYIPGPFREYYRALLSAEKADRMLHEAQAAGKLDWHLLDLEREAALGELAGVKGQIATDAIFALRLALALNPAGLDSIIGQVPAVRRLRARTRRLRRRLVKLEAVVVAMAEKGVMG